MKPNREQGRALRAAYTKAWNDRISAGSVDSSLLDKRLYESGLNSVLDSSRSTRQYLFDLWHRGVPPQDWNSAFFREVIKDVPSLHNDWQKLRRAFRHAESGVTHTNLSEGKFGDEPPAGILTVLDEVDKPTRITVPFEVTRHSEPVLRRWLSNQPNGNQWHHLGVWLIMDDKSGAAWVVRGSTLVGTVTVPAILWGRMCDAANENLYADGFLELRHKNGALECGDIEGWFPS